MEKEKKTIKQPAKKVSKSTAPKTTKVAPKNVKPVKQEVRPAKVEKVVETKIEVASEEIKKSKRTLNQEFNLLIGLFSLMIIVSFCFVFQGGNAELSGWEVLLKSGEYSGVFQVLMIAYLATIFIDCILAIRIDTENAVLDLIEKALYMFTVVMNFIVVAVLLTLISNIGIGFIIFFAIRRKKRNIY